MPERNDNNSGGTLRVDNAGMKSILSSVPELMNNNDLREMSLVRNSFYDRLPEECRTESVQTAWQELWSKAVAYFSPSQMHQLGKALLFAGEAHATQMRSTGDPYIIHTVSVASILADIQSDPATLCAALLHDVLEDTEITAPELSAIFGEEILNLVEGVTKLGKHPLMSNEDYQAGNLHKIFVAMARDFRVVLIKLADRLHNMRTLGILRRDKRERIARETLEIFAPLAHRLGIYQMKRDLEDLAFRYLQPEIYNDVRRRVRKKLPEREEVVKKGIALLEERLAAEKIPCKIKGRTKHFYSIYEKMERKKISMDEVYDILAIRVLVEDLSACYAVLGIVHSMWVPVPGQFDDYIANPKSNMYQSLHTTVMAFGVPVEVQIRTREMNRLAEYGIAAHWLYKTGGGTANSLDTKLTWVRQALEGDHEGRDPQEFLELLKSDILASEVYVFTPKGKPLVLPKGATTIDFAYAVHTEVGNHCVGAMVNNRIVPLGTELNNGDSVRIITSPQGTPSRDWLKTVRSTKTRAKIRNYFRQIEKTNREEKITRGWEALERELKKRSVIVKDQEEFSPALNKVARDLGQGGKEDLLTALGSGAAGPSMVAQRLALAYFQQQQTGDDKDELTQLLKKHAVRKRPEFDIIVEGAEGVAVTLSNCCLPVPGDSIVGYSTRVRGITVHRVDCTNILNAQMGRVIQVSWDVPSGRFYMARIWAEAVDRDDLVREVAHVIGLANGSIHEIRVSVIDGSLARIKMVLRVRNLEHLYEIVGKLNGIRGMLEVGRV